MEEQDADCRHQITLFVSEASAGALMGRTVQLPACLQLMQTRDSAQLSETLNISPSLNAHLRNIPSTPAALGSSKDKCRFWVFFFYFF